jgi:hypothetical protein
VLNSVEFIRSEHSLFSWAIGAIFYLHRWTLHRTVGAKDAAVALLGAQHCLAADAFVENLASASWHRLALSEAADRTLQHRFQKNVDHINIFQEPWKRRAKFTVFDEGAGSNDDLIEVPIKYSLHRCAHAAPNLARQLDIEVRRGQPTNPDKSALRRE